MPPHSEERLAFTGTGGSRDVELVDSSASTTVCTSQEERGERRPRSTCKRILATFGPGLMACLADTDGPCLITAAQSGADWQYKLLLLQIVLVPILFAAQELTVRLGLVRGKGMTALLREDAGAIWAWVVSLPLLATCVLGLISEFSAIGQTMAFWGAPVWLTNTFVVVILTMLVLSGSFSVAEKVGLAMGICQVVFLATMFIAKPKINEIVDDIADFPLNKSGFVKLVTANIGAVIMPWMLAYQQSAICNKGLINHGCEDLNLERVDTAIGSVLTQAVMAAMLITVAAAGSGKSVDTYNDLLSIFAAVLGGETQAKVLLTFAVVGACSVAAIVQTHCAAWTLEEATGGGASFGTSSQASGGVFQLVRRRPVFYLTYAVTCVVAFAYTLIADDAVDLSVYTEFFNGILMPPVVFALWYLAAYKLPEEHKLGCCTKWVLFVAFLICSVFCLGSLFVSFGGR